MAHLTYFGFSPDPIADAFSGGFAFEILQKSATSLTLQNPVNYFTVTVSGLNMVVGSTSATSAGRLDQITIRDADERVLMTIKLSGHTLPSFLAALEENQRVGSPNALIDYIGYIYLDARTAERGTSLDYSNHKDDFYVLGTAYGDRLIGGAERNSFDGRDGNDTLIGGSGNSSLYGGSGDDLFIAGSGRTYVYASQHHDTLDLRDSDVGAVTFRQGRVEILYYPEFSAKLYPLDTSAWVTEYRIDTAAGISEAKIELWDSYSGSTQILGLEALLRQGKFTLLPDAMPSRVEAKLQSGEHLYIRHETGKVDYDLSGAGKVTFSFLESPFMVPVPGVRVDFTAGTLQLGTKGAQLSTLKIDATTALEIVGTQSADLLVGGLANDTFYPIRGADTIDGGGGTDTISFIMPAFVTEVIPEHQRNSLPGTTGLYMNLSQGISQFTVAGAQHSQTIRNVESVIGTGSADRIIGVGRDGHLFGGGGADFLSAGDLNLEDNFRESGQVYRLYAAMLDRVPDRAGLQDWSTRLALGQADASSIAVGFMNSLEFRQKYGGLSNVDFVTMLYNNVLGRAPDTGGLAHWVGQLEDGARRSELVLGFANSVEFSNAVNPAAAAFVKHGEESTWVDDVFRLYHATLDRDPNKAGFFDWLDQLSSGMSLEQAARIFVGSAEFVQRYGSLDNEAFVRLLYRNVLDREASPAGLADWVAKLEGGLSRESVVLGFSQSQEFIIKTNTPFVEWMRLQGGVTLEGGLGNDTLTGGAMADVFVFDVSHKGADVVRDFEAWDLLRFEGFGYRSADDVRGQLAQVGSSVVFEDLGVKVTLENFTLQQVTDEILVF